MLVTVFRLFNFAYGGLKWTLVLSFHFSMGTRQSNSLVKTSFSPFKRCRESDADTSSYQIETSYMHGT